jgi:hypothetical protein
MTEDEKNVALTEAAEGADVAPNGAKSERSPVQIRSGPPIDKSTTFRSNRLMFGEIISHAL